MRRFAAALILFGASLSVANEPVHLQATVIAADGRPVDGADVWIITSKMPRERPGIAAHATTDAAGRFEFAAELLEKVWVDSTFTQVLVRDRDGRIGTVYYIARDTRTLSNPNRIKVADVGDVRGRIVDSDGKPIAGARIAVSEFGIDTPGRSFLEFAMVPAGIAERYRGETNSDGRFIIHGVPIGARITADVTADGFARVILDWDTAKPPELRLPRPKAVVGRLIGGSEADRAGRGLTLVSADMFRRNDRRGPLLTAFDASQTTALDGTFRFEGVPPGRFTLAPTDRYIGRLYLESQSVEVKSGSEPAVVELPLKTARKLRGRVVDGAGLGVAGVRVLLGRIYPRGKLTNQNVFSHDYSEAHTNSEGSFEGYMIPGMLAGATYQVLPEGYARKGDNLVVAENDATEALPPLVVEKIEPLVVRVVDSNGNSVSGATVEVGGATRFLSHGPAKPSGADGIVRLPLADRGAEATLRAVAGDAVSEPMTIDPEKERGPLTLTVSRANAFWIRGQLVDRVGKPAAETQVTVMRAVSAYSRRISLTVGGNYPIRTISTDSEGRFIAGPFGPGDKYSVAVRNGDYRAFVSEIVDANKGETHDFGRLVLTRTDAAVRGRVVDSAGSPVVGARVVNSGDAPGPLRTVSGPDGSFELKGLAAGRVHIVAFHDGFLPARVAVDTDKPGSAALTLRRRGEPSGEPQPDAIDDTAVRAAAKQVLERLWEWPEARKEPVNQKIVALMARLDPVKARAWAGKSGPVEPTIDELVKEDLDAALAQLATRDADLGCRELKRLAEKYREKDPDKALRLVEELIIKARTLDPRYRLFSLADAGRLLTQLGKSEAGRKLVEEAAIQAETLPPSDEWNRYVRGYVAGRVAPFDLPRAKRLIEVTTVPHERGRYLAMCANGVATSDPKAALELLRSIDKGILRVQRAPSVAFLMAPADTDAAIRLAEEIGEGSSYTVRALAWAALAVAPKNQPLAFRLIDRAFEIVHNDVPHGGNWDFFGSRGESAAVVALAGSTIGYPSRGALVAHVFAERPTDQENPGSGQPATVSAGLALLLAAVDRAAARELLGTVKPVFETHEGVRAAARFGTIGAGVPNIHRYLAAMAMIDPERAVPLLNTEIDRLKAENTAFPRRCELLDVLSLMTAPAADRPAALAVWLSIGWPTEMIE